MEWKSEGKEMVGPREVAKVQPTKAVTAESVRP